MRIKVERPTPRRIVSVFAAIGLMTGLLATLGSAGVAQATGVPPGGFIIQAGSVATLTSAEFNKDATNSLSWGYSLDGGTEQIQRTNSPGTEVFGPNVTIPASAVDQTLQVFLIDNHCQGVTFYSDGTPADHVTTTGTTPYSMDFFDAGGNCESATIDRHDAPGTFNFRVNFGIPPFPLTITKTVRTSSVSPGSLDTYDITVNNPNPDPVALTSIIDTLPLGLTYSGESSFIVGGESGLSDPAQQLTEGGNQQLTWPDPVTVPAGRSSTLEFTAQVSADEPSGDYLNTADGTADGHTVIGSGPTADVFVTGGSGCPAVAPDAPTNVVAYPGNTSAVLTWTAPADGGAPIDHYTVNIYDQSTEGSSSFQTSDASTSAQVSDLINGDSYRFGVQATNCAGTGQESALSDAVTPAAGSSAEVIGPGNLSQTTGTPGVPPSPDDTTVGAQIFPPGTTGIGTLQELGPGGPAAIRGAVPIGQFCGGSICLGNVLQAELIGGGLGPNPHGGVAFYRLRLLLDRSIVPDFTKAYQVWYDGNLTDDNDSPVDPTPPATLSRCPKVFTGTPCIAQIRRTETLDLRIVVKSSDLDPRLSTSK